MCHLLIIIVIVSYDKTLIIHGFVFSGTHCIYIYKYVLFISNFTYLNNISKNQKMLQEGNDDEIYLTFSFIDTIA